MLERGGARARSHRFSSCEGVACGEAEPLGGPGYEWRRLVSQYSVIPPPLLPPLVDRRPVLCSEIPSYWDRLGAATMG